VDGHRVKLEVHFVTFAYPGKRWDLVNSRRALRLMYSSLESSQVELPTLHVYTSLPSVIPTTTLRGSKPKITLHFLDREEFPKNPYTSINDWKSLSRSKLDVVEELLRRGHDHVVWIDIDTLVFVDLAKVFELSATFLVGFQHGSCGGRSDCTREDVHITPEFDAHGDLWSIDLSTIDKVRKFEHMYLSNSSNSLPRYDLQAYFSFMLQAGILPPSILVHRILPTYNFGFVCSDFKHPTSSNLHLFILNDQLHCQDAVLKMPKTVGSISFTSPTFRKMFLNEDIPTFSSVRNPEVRRWLESRLLA